MAEEVGECRLNLREAFYIVYVAKGSSGGLCICIGELLRGNIT